MSHDTRNQLLAETQKIVDRAQAENRDLTQEETRKLDSHLARMNALDRIAREENRPQNTPVFPSNYEWQWHDGTKMRGVEPVTNSKPSPRQWTDRSGQVVNVVGKGDRWANPKNAEESLLSLGNVIRAVASGDNRFMQRESRIMNAMGGSSNVGGGFLVPTELAGFVIDLARANSALAQAGVPFVEMTSDTMTLATVASDPTFSTHLENVAIAESDIGFGAINFKARSIATICRLSRELAADAPNAAALVSSVLAKSLAAEADRQGIAGDGNAEEVGLLNHASIAETGSVGAIDWLNVHHAVTAVRAANHEPTGYIAHPEIAGDLDAITSGDGSTSARGWLGAPPSLATVPRYVSTNCPTSGLIVGDFATGCAFGLRSQPILEVSTGGGDAFSRHSVLVKIVWRGCFRVMQPGAFHRLAGITT